MATRSRSTYQWVKLKHRSSVCMSPHTKRPSWLSNIAEPNEWFPRSVSGIINVIYRAINLKNKQRCRLIGQRIFKISSCSLITISCLRATATPAWCWPARTDACLQWRLTARRLHRDSYLLCGVPWCCSCHCWCSVLQLLVVLCVFLHLCVWLFFYFLVLLGIPLFTCQFCARGRV